uniref:Putative tick cistatins 1 n=1 Tax=Amblyomma triste TaxID=251400 RepID=A0A023G6N2_AMBTT
MASSFRLAAVLITFFVSYGFSALIGGWHQKNVEDKKSEYEEMARFALSWQTRNGECKGRVLDVIAVHTQVVAGMNYRITFTIDNLECSAANSNTGGRRHSQQGKKTCTAVIYAPLGNAPRSVSKFSCQ